MRLESININWPASKDVVSRFAEQALYFERKKDVQFRERVAGANNLEALLMDLGHFARGLQEFPVRLPIIVLAPVSQTPNSRENVTQTNGKHFFEAITNRIEQYKTQLEPQSFSARLLRDLDPSVRAINSLANQTESTLIQVYLGETNGSDENGPIPNFYRIRGLETDYYMA